MPGGQPPSHVLSNVYGHGHHDDDGARDLLEIRGDVQDVQPVLHDADDEGADERAPRASQASREARAADDRCGDRVQLVAQAETRLARADARGENDGGNRGEETGKGIDQDDVAVRLDPRDHGGLQVAPQGVGVAAPQGMLEDHVGDRDADQQHDGGVGNAQDGSLPDDLEGIDEAPARPPLRVDECPAAGKGHHAEGRDEGRDLQLADHRAVEEPDEHTQARAR